MPPTQPVIERYEGSINSILDYRKNQNMVPTVFLLLRYIRVIIVFFLQYILKNDRQQAADGYLFFPSGIAWKDCECPIDHCDCCSYLVSPKLWTMMLTFLKGQCKYFIYTVHTLERSRRLPKCPVSRYTTEASHRWVHDPDNMSFWKTLDPDVRSDYLDSLRIKAQKCCNTTMAEIFILQKGCRITRRFIDSAGDSYSGWLHPPMMQLNLVKEIIKIRVDALLGERLLRSMHPELRTLISRSCRREIEQLLIKGHTTIEFTQLCPDPREPIFTERDECGYILWTHPDINISSPSDQEITPTQHQQKASRVMERFEASIDSILDYGEDHHTIPTVFCILRYLYVAAGLCLKDIRDNDLHKAADRYLFFPIGIDRKFRFPDTGHYQCHLPKYPCDSCPLVSPKLWGMMLCLLEGQCKYFTSTVHTLERRSCLSNSSVLQDTAEPFHRLLLDLHDRSLWNTYVANDHRGHFLSRRFKVQECCDKTMGEIIYLREGGRSKRSFTNPERDVYFDLLRSMHLELMTLISSSCRQEIEELLKEGDMTIGFTQLCPHPREPIFTERDRYLYRLWTHPAIKVVGYSCSPEHMSSSSSSSLG